MLKNLWIASLVTTLLVAASGLNFFKSYNISTTVMGVIEAPIIKIAQTRYLITAILLLISAIFYSALQYQIHSQQKA